MSVTIYDIAKEAGVSPSTVSLTMNNSSKIKEETKKYVREVAKRMGYTPNYAARSLINNRSFTIGVVVPNLTNPFFTATLSEIVHTANDYGYNIMLGSSEQSIDKERNYIEMLSEQRVDGIVLFPSFLEELFPDFIKGKDDATIPLVLCGSSTTSSDNITFVKCDNHMGGYLATEHLIKCGKKRIACLCAVKEKSQALSRIAGYRDAHEFWGLTYDKNLICFCQNETDDIFASTISLIKEHNVDAFFCLFDDMCLPVIRAVQSLGKSIPDDIAIVGYDNIDSSSRLPITLTSIDTHSRTIGSMAIKQLINKIENPTSEVRKIILKPELVIRESTVKNT